MKKLRVLNYGFTGIITVLAALMCWMGSVMYQAQQTRLNSEVLQAINKAGDSLRTLSVTQLNYLADVIGAEDFKTKAAFAAGATGNTGRMREWFDEDNERVNRRIVEQNARAHKGSGVNHVIEIDTTFLRKNNISYNPDNAIKIADFEGLFKSDIGQRGIGLSYEIHRQSPDDTAFSNPIYQYSSPGFIIDFYHPKLYRVDYTIATGTIIKGMLVYIIISLLTLLLVTAAYVFMKRSYAMQVQMAAFKESLFSNITHEFKTPLSSLQIIVDTAKGSGNAMPAQHIEFAATELTRMRLIVEKILAFGKMSSEQFALNKELVDVNEVIQDAIDVMQLNIAQSNATINYTATDSLILAGDKVLLINAIATMIDNAIKYNNDAPQIDITAANHEGVITMRIADNGIGIAPMYRKKIFEPFFRIPQGNVHNVKGHGLGLSFVAQVVQLHKGSIVADANNTGSIFTISLPINAA